MEYNIRFVGIGGQGIVLSSIILAHAAVLNGLNALQTQRYGAEVRGGEVYADVKISNKELYSSSIDEADIVVGFAYGVLTKHINIIKNNGSLFVDKDLVPNVPQTSKKIGSVYKVPATRIAVELGNKRVANIVMLGAMNMVLRIVPDEYMMKSIGLHVPKKYIELNKKAYQEGKQFMQSQYLIK